MGSIARSGTWDEASSPAATRLARRFEEAWRDPRRRQKPDPAEFLPDGAQAPPAAWLAVLRAELNLRWDDGESVRVEEYRGRFPGLDAETMVALCYEEFCRREEDGLAPFPTEYDERFPDLSDRLKRVFDIHEILGNASSTDLHVPGPEVIPFPEAGQTIAGFFLVEELGRGSFARVFLARERQLADRFVALKVSRTGSREPQTLARLQHTHIVPVHSYRTDPATGLHLLCMPYFGRVTLARLLGEPEARATESGAGFLEALDRLESPGTGDVASSTRSTVARLPHARAVAWWGARLAEALAHAHDRGVLHRDIKPSNVLVTADGLPMLLDFNLAGEPWADRSEFQPDNLGGTLAYMAPEHLDAVACGHDDQLDGRADLFSLGVLLYEALIGSRPFPAPKGSSVPEALERAAEDRRREPPWLCPTHPEIPGALERVIRRALDPDPSCRFPNAGEFAADLQAVADDAPLKWTREPLTVRAVRLARRSWKKAVLVAVLAGSSVAFLMSTFRADAERVQAGRTASSLFEEGRRAFATDDFVTAAARFDEVERLTIGHPELTPTLLDSVVHRRRARLAAEVRHDCDTLFGGVEKLRYRLRDEPNRPEESGRLLESLLRPFHVFDDAGWAGRPELVSLDPSRKARLFREVDEILYQFTAGLDPRDASGSRRGFACCDRALAFTDDRRPWLALRAWLDDSSPIAIADDPSEQISARSCYETALLLDRLGRRSSAIRWLTQATRIEPGVSWYHFQLANWSSRNGDAEAAREQFDLALAIEPKNPAFRQGLAKVLRSVGEWDRARREEDRAKASP